MCKVFCHNTQCLSSQTSVQYVFQILLFFIRQRWRIAKGYLKCCTKFVNLSGKKLYTLSGSDATVACPTCTAVNVGVPILETDLFTNVSKLCPNYDT